MRITCSLPLRIDDPWRPISEFAGQAPFEHIRRLDEMIVDREQQEPATALGRVRKQSKVTLLCGSCLCLRTQLRAKGIVP